MRAKVELGLKRRIPDHGQTTWSAKKQSNDTTVSYLIINGAPYARKRRTYSLFLVVFPGLISGAKFV